MVAKISPELEKIAKLKEKEIIFTTGFKYLKILCLSGAMAEKCLIREEKARF
jgi:hypothetical protein